MKFLPVCRVSEWPFPPHWDWQIDPEEFLIWSKNLILQMNQQWTAVTILLSLSFDTAPTLLKILFATT